MDAELKRRRFQIHLSTAIMLMFVAGGIVWANMRSIGYAHGSLTAVGRVENEPEWKRYFSDN